MLLIPPNSRGCTSHPQMPKISLFDNLPRIRADLREGYKAGDTRMFTTLQEALQRAPPLNTSMGVMSRPSQVVVNSFGDSGLFLAEQDLTPWTSDNIFMTSGVNRLAGVSVHGRWMSVANRIAVATAQDGPLVMLPGCDDTIACAAMHTIGSIVRKSNQCLVAVGTQAGLQVFWLKTAEKTSGIQIVGQALVTQGSVEHVEFRSCEQSLLLVRSSGTVAVAQIHLDHSRSEIRTTVVEGSLHSKGWMEWCQRTVTLRSRVQEKFISASYDSARHHVLVLTTELLSVWTVSDQPTQRASIRLAPGAIGIHRSLPEQEHLATAVFASGKRVIVKSTTQSQGGRLQLAVVDEVVFPSNVNIKQVSSTAAVAGTIVMYDCKLRSLVLEASDVPFCDASPERCVVVTTLQVPGDVIGVTALEKDADCDCRFVVHGRQGPLAIIVRRPFPDVFRLRLMQHSETVQHALTCLGREATARLLIEGLEVAEDNLVDGSRSSSSHLISSTVNTVFTSCLVSLVAPEVKCNGEEVELSVVAAALRRIALEATHNVSFLLKTPLDEESIQCLRVLHFDCDATLAKIKIALTDEGWLDTTHLAHLVPVDEVRWRDLTIKSERRQLTIAAAVALQAAFMKEIMSCLGYLRSLCALHVAAYDYGVRIPVLIFPISMSAWQQSMRYSELRSLGVALASGASVAALNALERLLPQLPSIVRSFAELKRVSFLLQSNDEDDASVSACLSCLNKHMPTLMSESMVLQAIDLLEVSQRRPSHLRLRCLAEWAAQDTSGAAIEDVVTTVEAISDERVMLQEIVPIISTVDRQDACQRLLEWVLTHSLEDKRHQAFVEMFGVLVTRVGSMITQVNTSPVGVCMYAEVLLEQSSQQAMGVKRREARGMLLHVAHWPEAFLLSERMIALRLAVKADESRAAEVALDIAVGELQEQLRLSMSCAATTHANEELATSLSNYSEQLRWVLLSSKDLYDFAHQWRLTPGVCAANIQLELLLRYHSDNGTYDYMQNDLLNAIEGVLLGFMDEHPDDGAQDKNKGTSLRSQAIQKFLASGIPSRLPDTLPMISFYVAFLAEGTAGAGTFCADCSCLVDAGVDAGQVFFSVLSNKDKLEAVPGGFASMLITLLRLLQRNTFSFDDRVACIEMLISVLKDTRLEGPLVSESRDAVEQEVEATASALPTPELKELVLQLRTIITDL